MNGSPVRELERFVIAACEHLRIPVRRTTSEETQIDIPAPLRRRFGNIEQFKVTALPLMRQQNPDLEILSPTSFLLQCLVDLLSSEVVPISTLVAGVPSRVNAEEYAAAFAERLLDPGRPDTTLPAGFELRKLSETVAFRSFLRVLAEVRVAGVSPIHEVFPILVELTSGKVVDPIRFATRTLYAPDEIGIVAAALPKTPAAADLKAALDATEQAAATTAGILGGIASGPVGERLDRQRAELERYYHTQLTTALTEEQQKSTREELEVRLRALDEARNVRTSVKAVSAAVVHEVTPQLRVLVADRRGRVHEVTIPAIAGLAEIPDDVVQCGHLNRPLSILPGEGIVCGTCAPRCEQCAIGVRSSVCRVCRSAGRSTCGACVEKADHGGTACADHIYRCAGGETHVHGGEVPCVDCGLLVCEDPGHRLVCAGDKAVRCVACDAAVPMKRCGVCSALLCAEHRVETRDDAVTCPGCVARCRTDDAPHLPKAGALCGAPASGMSDDPPCGWHCRSHLKQVVCSHAQVCRTHFVQSALDEVPVCRSCASECDWCAITFARTQLLACCISGCTRSMCPADAQGHSCVECRSPACHEHLRACEVTGDSLCWTHRATCVDCRRSQRSTRIAACAACSARRCLDCLLAGRDGELLCRACAAQCSVDGAVDRRSSLQACADVAESPHLLCRDHRIETPCCGASVCTQHLKNSVVSSRPLCPKCAVLCADCRSTMAIGEGAACTSCGAVYCEVNERAPRCPEGNHVSCAAHSLRCALSGIDACRTHIVACSVCKQKARESLLEHCVGCSARCCPGHFSACRIDGVRLCPRCAETSELHEGVFCSSHLKRCGSCGAATPYLSADRSVCVHCELFVSEAPSAPLPFGQSLLDELVKKHGGLLPKSASVRWRVGERLVAVSIRTRLMKKATHLLMRYDGTPGPEWRPGRFPDGDRA